MTTNFVQSVSANNPIVKAFQLGAIAQMAMLQANALAQQGAAQQQLFMAPQQNVAQPQVIVVPQPVAQQPHVIVVPQPVAQPQVNNTEQVLQALLNELNGLKTFLSQLVAPKGKVKDNNAKDGTADSDDTVDVKKLEEIFKEIDADGKDGISKEEFVKGYVKDVERKYNIRFTNENNPKLAEIRKEAENLFEALKDPKEANLTKERFDKIVKYYDKASDGTTDGKIKKSYLMTDMDKIKNEGKDVKISDGKTLEENLEAVA